MENKKENLIAKIVKKYSLELLLLFGSRAIRKSHEKSDFDVAYRSKKVLSLREESELSLDLASVFESENIDLVNLKKAPPLLFYAIFKDSKVLFEIKPLLFDHLRSYSFKRYIETKPLREASYNKLQKEIKSYDI